MVRNHTCAPLTTTHSPILSPPIKYHSHHTSRFLAPQFFPHLLSPRIPCHPGRTPAKQCQQRRRQRRKQNNSQRSPLWQLRPLQPRRGILLSYPPPHQRKGRTTRQLPLHPCAISDMQLTVLGKRVCQTKSKEDKCEKLKRTTL